MTPTGGTERPARVSERVVRFQEAMAAASARTHGPLEPGAAADLAVRLAAERAGGGPVAVATGDALLAALDVPARLDASGTAVLRPDDPQWHDALATAGAGLTGALVGVAATGSVCVGCGPGAPRAVSLVPPAHVCLVRAADIIDDLGEAVATIAAAGLPSALAWISGPSRSADLEMTLTVGVHGPGSVDIVIVAAAE